MNSLEALARQACSCNHPNCVTVRRVRKVLDQAIRDAWADGVIAGLRVAVHVLDRERALAPPFGGPLAGAFAIVDGFIDKVRKLIP